ncbi:MAG: phosphonate ABC transporter, permease protein PhnE [Armatimonadetes bacterium]|nr:phosphonate ABC transporter, permease protein PhnE [Armatimonadota bacterium]
MPRGLPVSRPWFRSWRFVAFLLALVFIYAYGWRVTKIDLGAIVGGARFVRPFLRDLVRPDVINRPLRSHDARVGFSTDPAAAPETFPADPSGRAITVSRPTGQPGDTIEVRGHGFHPNGSGLILWQNQIGNRQRVAPFTTDAHGEFRTTVTVPESQGTRQQIIAEVSWEEGAWRLSPTFWLVGEKIVETIFLALMGTTIAVIAAVPLSFLGARNLMARTAAGSSVYFVTRTFFNIMRSVEPLILAIIFTVWVGLGPFAGVMALALHSVASLGKLYSEQIESIDPGPIEAITATGASTLQVIRYGVVPQIVPQFIAFTIYRWDINVRMSTVIGFVGGGGIGFILQQYINLLQYRQAATAVWAITIVVAVMDYLSAVIRERIV